MMAILSIVVELKIIGCPCRVPKDRANRYLIAAMYFIEAGRRKPWLNFANYCNGATTLMIIGSPDTRILFCNEQTENQGTQCLFPPDASNDDVHKSRISG